MKYTCEIEINKPVDKVVALFDSLENMKHWQPGLVGYEHLSGTPGQPGAKMLLKYDHKGRKMEMTETITVRNFPEEFSGVYETKGVYNVMVNRFRDMGNGKTKWIAESEFRFSGFMKIIGFLMKGAFPKQTMVFLNKFREFAENQN